MIFALTILAHVRSATSLAYGLHNSRPGNGKGFAMLTEYTFIEICLGTEN